jgi:hypothetical protein
MWTGRESNPRSPLCKSDILPLNYRPKYLKIYSQLYLINIKNSIKMRHQRVPHAPDLLVIY